MGPSVMKICIFTNHFFPENFKVNDIVFELAKRGYEITVITAIPDYPQGTFYDGYSLFKRRREYINGVLIIRLPIIPRRNGTRLSLIFNYVSYFISSLIFTFFHWYSMKYDAVFVHLTSPFFICLPAALLKRKQRIPLVLWVLDLWPESLSAAGEIKNRLILYTQTILVRYVYDNSDTILIGSKGFESSICEKGNYKDKLIYFPNWAESIVPIKDDTWYQQLKPFADFSKDDFIILFTGNIGEAQNLDCIIDVAVELKSNHAIKFVFIGNGRKKESLENKAKELYLYDCVFFPGQYPLETMPVFMQMADILLVSLKDELIFNLTVPSKVQFYMAQGKPILAMLNGDGADIINAARCGKAVPANDSKALQCAIQEFYDMPKQELRILGSNGKKYYETYFGKEQRMEQLNDLFRNIAML
jgi:glycosyltransferase involved in cell wall biosynthesis